MQTSTPDPLVLKLRSPDDILEAVPYLLGFEPTASLVALSLRGPRRRLGLTLRVDLVDPDGVELVAAQVVSSLLADGAESVVIVGYSGQDCPAVDSLVAAVVAGLEAARVAVSEALRVHEGRWTSYTCQKPCCPPDGTEVRDRMAAPSGVGSAAVAAGHQVFAGRDALAATVAPVTGLLWTAMTAALDRELDRFELANNADDRAYRVATVELVRAVLERNRDDGGNDDGGPRAFELTVDDAARILVGALDVVARDALLDGWDGGPELADDPMPRDATDNVADVPGRGPTGAGAPDVVVGCGISADLRPGAERLWSELLRRAVLPGLAAPVATLLAWNLYVHHGGGAMVTIALERALDDVPGYVMAEGLLSLLMGGISPERFAEMVADPRAGFGVPVWAGGVDAGGGAGGGLGVRGGAHGGGRGRSRRGGKGARSARRRRSA